MNQSAAELFLASCGADTSLRVLVTARGSESRCEHRFDRPFLIAGSAPRSCLRLQDPGVSRRHAYFQVVEGRLFCVDLGSRTGVVWPGGAVGSGGWLSSPSEVRLGSHSLAPRTNGPDGEIPPPAAPDWDPLRDGVERPGWPQAAIEVSGGGQPKTVRYRLNRMVVLVGSSPSCRIRLHHPSVSRFHCSLVWTPQGVWLVDLLSRHGTQLNGQTVAWAPVSDGDEIAVGAYRLRFRYAAGGDAGRLAPDAAGLVVNRSDRLLLPPTVSPPRLEAGADCPLADRDQGGELSVPAGAGAESQLLLPLMQQFNFMQQQLCEQFQQTTLMMFRMFTTMHQEQAAVFREEMQRMQTITEELHALQRKARDGALPGREVPSLRGTPLHPAPFPSARSGDKASTDAGSATAPAPPASPTPDTQPPPANPGDMDAWLNQRIGELQAERQTHWQRMMGFLSGQ